MSFFSQAAILLASAVVAVPLFKRLGFGSVLGYLAAGLIIGPWGLRLITGVNYILHFSQLGVVMLLFVIGLELQPSRLWILRRRVFGLGSAQVVTAGALLTGLGLAAGLNWRAALVAGFGLSLSSTAFSLQMLAEKKELTSQYGRAAFAILLFQDLAVIPMLAGVRLLGYGVDTTHAGNAITTALTIIGAIAFIIVGGRYLLRPVLRLIAAARSQEVFTAAALLVVIAAALLTESVGLSMGLGAFLAGVLLAGSEYRHELSADIEPFKGLLLGLFFIAVGMTANVGLIVTRPLEIVALALALLAVKFMVIYGLARLGRLTAEGSRNLAFSIAQGGEFAFVLFSASVDRGVLPRATSELLIVVVTVSMALTPVLVIFNDRVLNRLFKRDTERAFDTIDNTNHHVIIAGFGRFGQIIGRLLRVKKIPFTALEIDPSQVDVIRRFGNKIYYGDASRLDLLRAARAEKASIFVLALDDVQASLRTVRTLRRHFPALTIYARARNRYHAHLLMDLGVKVIVRETFLSSLDMGGRVLRGLGEEEDEVAHALETFRVHDEKTLANQLAVFRDEAKLIQTGREAAEELEQLFESDTSQNDASPSRSRGGVRMDHGRTTTVPEHIARGKES